MLSVDFFCTKPTATKKTKLRTEIARLETRPGGMQQDGILLPAGRRPQIDKKVGETGASWERHGGQM